MNNKIISQRQWKGEYKEHEGWTGYSLYFEVELENGMRVVDRIDISDTADGSENAFFMKTLNKRIRRALDIQHCRDLHIPFQL